jgi:hypothetical protein
MKLHGNARLTLHGRRLLVERVCSREFSLQMAADAAGVSTRTASKWGDRIPRPQESSGHEERQHRNHAKRGTQQLVAELDAAQSREYTDHAGEHLDAPVGLACP